MTCVEHLMRNCPERVKSHFEDVDQPFTKVEALKISQTEKIFCAWLQMLLHGGKAGLMLS